MNRGYRYRCCARIVGNKNDARIRLRWNDSWLYVRSGALRLRALRTRRTHIALRRSREAVLESGLGSEVGRAGASTSKAQARTIPRKAARATSRSILRKTSSASSRRSTSRTSSSSSAARRCLPPKAAAPARDMAELFPAPEFRLTLIGKDITQQIDVDPEGGARAAHVRLVRRARGKGARRRRRRLHAPLRARAAAERAAEEPAHWQLRFGLLSFIVQMPHMGLLMEAEAVKGSALTDDEKALLEERAMYARFWLANYRRSNLNMCCRRRCRKA